MNIVWCVLIVLSSIFMCFNQPDTFVGVLNEAGAQTVALALKLIGIYVIWMGLLQILQNCGLSKKLAKLLKPVIKLIFSNVNDETSELIAINLTANMLGLGNAGTPAGLKAIKELDDGNNKPNRNMIMLVCINCCSIQILPTTIIAIKAACGSSNANSIIAPILIVSVICFLLIIGLVKIFSK